MVTGPVGLCGSATQGSEVTLSDAGGHGWIGEGSGVEDLEAVDERRVVSILEQYYR